MFYEKNACFTGYLCVAKMKGMYYSK